MIDKSKLKELALDATMGPYTFGSEYVAKPTGTGAYTYIARCPDGEEDTPKWEANAAFFAAANPAAILELLAELESARNAALEEAARVVEARFIGFRVDDAELTAMAAEIRALATNASTEPASRGRAQGGNTCNETGGSSPADAGGLTHERIEEIWAGIPADGSVNDIRANFARAIEREVLATKAAQPKTPAPLGNLAYSDDRGYYVEWHIGIPAVGTELYSAVGASPAPSAKQEPKMTIRDGIWWPEGYCTDPDGRIVAPEGKHTDFKFGYDIGYKDGLVAHKDSVAAIEERVRANLSATSASASPAAPFAELSKHLREVAADPKADAISYLKHRMVLAADAIDGLAAAPAVPVPAEPQWITVEDRLPPEHCGLLLVTNNIGARNAYGCMSHVWLSHMIHKQDDGTFSAFARPSDSTVERITHWANIPAAPSLQQPKTGSQP